MDEEVNDIENGVSEEVSWCEKVSLLQFFDIF